MTRSFFLLFGLLLVTSQSIFAQELQDEIETYLQSYVKTSDFSGCVRILQQDSLLFDACFGYADTSRELKNTPNTQFKIGSISKQFTAAAILRLEEMGKLTTADTLSRFFPDHEVTNSITLEHLLTHSSGIQDVYSVPGFNTLSEKNLQISRLAEMVLQLPLVFQPGSQYQYSNGGYALLAVVIEKASGMDYGAFLKQELFDSLEMSDSGHGDITGLAIGYEPLDYEDLKVTEYLDPELLKGSGSLYSTTADLQKWIESIKTRSLLSKYSYGKFMKDYGHSYGLGISVYRSFDHTVFGHDGRINGYIADYLHYQEPNVSIIITGNIQTGIADFLRRDLAAIVFGKEFTSRAKSGTPESDPIRKAVDITGTYAFGPNFKVYVTLDGERYMARANEGGSSELVLLVDGRYFSRTLYAHIRFVRDEEGQITKMQWINNDGNQFEGIKEESSGK